MNSSALAALPPRRAAQANVRNVFSFSSSPVDRTGAAGRYLTGVALLTMFWLIGIAPVRGQDPIISEFMAANSSGLKDDDGAWNDWIEIYNAGPGAVSLAGWFLTDDPQNLRLWSFPSVSLGGRQFLVVFASGNDRRDAKTNLHTNFKLDREGEYLALVHPDGKTVASEFEPLYPPQLSDVSYGVSMSTSTEWLVGSESKGRKFVPADDGLGQSWVQAGFNDSAWLPVTAGIGYSRPLSPSDPVEPSTSVQDVTTPGDVLVPTSSNSPGNEGVINAIDNNPQTKYLNFDKLNAGFTVTPSSGPAVVTGLRFTSANDAPERDPTTFVLAGSNDGQSFVEVARGTVPDFTARFMTTEVTFNNVQAFRIFRLLFPTVRNASAAVAVQIAEIELLGHVGPPLPTLAELIETNVESDMFGKNASLYLRLPFVLAQVPERGELILTMRFDDGFVAWLNGVRVASANAPLALTFNSAAITNRFRAEAVQPARFDLSSFASLLRPGTNVLAIQGLNERAASAEFLLSAQLGNSHSTLGDHGYLTSSTPGTANSTASPGLVADPVFGPERGVFQAPVEVTISSATSGNSVRYTTDGSAPTLTNGTSYSSPIAVSRTTILRAAAFRDNWRPSQIVTHTYIFPEDVVRQTQASALAAGFPASWGTRAADYGLDSRVVGPGGQDKFGGKYAASLKADLQSLPSLSIVMDQQDLFGPRGIYSNPEAHGQAWERPASLELFYPDQPGGFHENSGVRIQGGAFRRFDLSLKKSFRLIFREKYGSTKLGYPFFGAGAATEFNNIVLRANSNDAWPYGGGSALYIRDAFAMDSARAMGLVASHSTFVHLYLNGLYWGLYNPVERPDAAFSASYFGGDKEAWDAVNQDSVPDGNALAWNRLLSLLNQDLSKTEIYQKLQGNNADGTRNPAYEALLDLKSLIDYMILNFYEGNADWPGRNWWVGRNREGTEGFQFYPWDTETALGLSPVTFDCTAVNSAVARPYAALRVNADFRMQFADRVYQHFFNGGAFYVDPSATAWDPTHPEKNRPAARFEALAEQVRQGIVGESARWGDQLRTTPFTRDENWQPARASMLTAYFPRRSAIVLDQLRRAGLFPQTEAPIMNQRGSEVAVGFQLTLRAAQGTVVYTIDGTDPRTSGSAKTYAGPISLQDLVTVKTRARNGQEWSALNEATFQVGNPKLTLTEIHYHPADPGPDEIAAGLSRASDFEFIELFNNRTVTADLTGLAFVDGVQFAFSNSSQTQLAPSQFLLLVSNRKAFEHRNGPGLTIAGEFSGQLDNSGERLRLVNAGGETVVDFVYETHGLWPSAPDGQGPSLERIDPENELMSPESWRASAVSGGSPGRANPTQVVSLSAFKASNAEVQFGFVGKAGLGYTVYAADSLASDSWEVVARGQPLPNVSVVEVKLPLTSTARARFFRVSIP